MGSFLLVALLATTLAPVCPCEGCTPPAVATAKAQTALQHETENFTIWSGDVRWPAAKVSALAESQRFHLYWHWQEEKEPRAWTPKCAIVVHASRASYLSAVGRSGGQSFGSSLLDLRKGVCHSRRIDLLADSHGKLSALSHELMHVLVADLLGNRPLPRWLDEGIAVLADPAAKQAAHSKDLDRAWQTREIFSVAEIMSLDEYPAAKKIPSFYAQSASLAALLARRGKPKQLIEFAEVSMKHGHDRALRDVYDIEGAAHLDRLWRASREEAWTYASNLPGQ